MKKLITKLITLFITFAMVLMSCSFSFYSDDQLYEASPEDLAYLDEQIEIEKARSTYRKLSAFFDFNNEYNYYPEWLAGVWISEGELYISTVKDLTTKKTVIELLNDDNFIFLNDAKYSLNLSTKIGHENRKSVPV